MTDHQILLDGLRAAQTSANHAGASAVAAWIFGCVGLLLNAGALVFVWRQLKASEVAANAAKAAVEVAQSETRPWIKVEPSDGATMSVGLNGSMSSGAVTMRVQIENVGKTPATCVVVRSEILITPSEKAGLVDRMAELANANGPDGSTVFPGDTLSITDTAIRIFPDQAMVPGFWLLCVVVYGSPNGKRHITPLLLGENTLSSATVTTGRIEVDFLNLVKSELQPT